MYDGADIHGVSHAGLLHRISFAKRQTRGSPSFCTITIVRLVPMIRLLQSIDRKFACFSDGHP
jgi:hypothetical protein